MPASQDQMFLTDSEAREAVRLDFASYGPQPKLYAAVLDALGRPPAQDSLLERALEALDERSPAGEELAGLCSLVFEASVRAGTDGAGRAGVFVCTGLGSFACTRCGRCCVALDFHRECTAEDVALWRAAGREDILAWVGEKRGPDGGPQYRIWKRPGTPFYAESCPWLRRVPGDRAFVCTIQDVKPEICRSYPGTAKHARMTGCPGFAGS
ncbi:YkgJ family cysteine cluster protein [Desulfocurvus sp. DL9XJH121]